MPMGYNRVLGDLRVPEAARPHRVAIASWPASVAEKRTASLEALLGHVATSGYEGLEAGVNLFARYMPGQSDAVVAGRVRRAIEKAGLRNFGTTLHIGDSVMRSLNWIDKQIENMKVSQDLGSEFISYQFFLHEDYMDTGGEYRDDERYLQWAAARVAELREAVWSLGMNFYLEVHVGRITEDPAACCRILDLVACELNGDMSHYLARGVTRGKHLERVLKHLGHTHVRMARKYGDLSAVVDDPKADWQQGGVTWQMFEMMKVGLGGGLSSRTIAGETGPMHLVKDTLTQDAALVPLYRAMARYADASAQGITMKVDGPSDLKPWG